MKSFKPFSFFILAFMLVVTSVTPSVSFAQDLIGVYVNDNMIEFDVEPQIINNRTMIPFRYVANAFGADVNYIENGDKKIVTAALDGKTIYLTIGSSSVIVEENGVQSEIISDVAPVIVPGGRTVVPVRLIAETFGHAVGWNGEAKQVVILTTDSLVEKYSASGKGIYNSLFGIDPEKLFGEYSFEFVVDSKMIFGTIAIDEDAVFCDVFIGEDFLEIATTDEYVYTRFNSLEDKDWVVKKIEDFKNESSIKYSNHMLTDEILKRFTEAFVDAAPSKDTYAALEGVFEVLCSDECDAKIVKTGSDTDYTATLRTQSEMGLKLEKTMENGLLKSFEISSLSAFGAFGIKIKLDREKISVTVPNIQ